VHAVGKYRRDHSKRKPKAGISSGLVPLAPLILGDKMSNIGGGRGSVSGFCPHRARRKGGGVRRLSPIPPQSLFSFFEGLRLPKTNAFPTSVIVDEINPSVFERASDSCFVCQRNGDLPVNNLGPTDRCDAYL
jgi:hypothetical protein